MSCLGARRAVVLGGVPGRAPSLDLDFTAGTADSRLTVTRAGTATRVNASGAIETVAANTARLDYDMQTLACKGLLVEAGSTNLLLNSATLSTQSVTVTAAAHTLSFYGTGTVTLTGTSTAGPLVGTGATQRVSLTFTPTAGSLTLTVSGTVSNAQLEAVSLPTSWIPTAGSSVTRNSDIVLLSDLSGLYNPTAGTLFAEWTFNTVSSAAEQAVCALDDGTGNERFTIRANLGVMAGIVVDGGAVQASVGLSGSPVSLANTVYKAALAWASNDAAYYQNGVAGATDVSVTLPTPTRLQLGGRAGTGSQNLYGHVRKLRLYTARQPAGALLVMTS